MARSNTADGFRMARPGGYVSIMLLVLIFIAGFVWIQQEFVLRVYGANRFLNSMIIFVLCVGVIYTFSQVFILGPCARWVENIRLRDPGIARRRAPELLAPMAALLRDPSGPMELNPVAMRSILDSIGSRLDETRENSRYMIGLLIFLGLLGTFWGLLQTIGAVGDTVDSLPTGTAPPSELLGQLKDGLKAPLIGMGLAFSSSLFGLSGSLILGFLDLQAAQAQNRFYNDLEEFLSTRTSLREGAGGSSEGATPNYAATQLMRAINRLEHTIANVNSGKGRDAAGAHDLTGTMHLLSDHMQRERDVFSRVSDTQAKLEPTLDKLSVATEKLVGTQSIVMEEIRDHIRHMDKMISEIARQTSGSEEAGMDGLKSDVRALRELITSIALDDLEKK